jgi:hypothetical protein
MKKDTQHRPGVSKSTAASLSAPGQQTLPPRTSDAGSSADVSAPTLSPPLPSFNLSARYIDSRLKQFCWR